MTDIHIFIVCCILGAGGGKVRPDLSKQRSLSGTPSPSHSRSASASSDLANMVRSSSEGNLPDPSEIVERLKQGEVNFVCEYCCICAHYNRKCFTHL